MAKAAPGPGTSDSIEADLKRLDVGLRRLKVQYDMFFAGALKRQPVELRAEVEKIIKRYVNAPIQKYAHRFHLNTLISRYNSLSELWGKTIRTREEGDRRPAATPATAPQQPQQGLVARCRIREARADDADLRELYERFISARRTHGTGREREIPYDKFVKGISKQTESLQKRAGCGEIELRVVVSDHKVELKARPGR